MEEEKEKKVRDENDNNEDTLRFGALGVKELKTAFVNKTV
jgi:hypothetical protein